MSQPQGHSAAGRIMSMKNSNAPSSIEPATFLLVGQCLNQLRYRVPPVVVVVVVVVVAAAAAAAVVVVVVVVVVNEVILDK
jgi:hypothetical protein